MTALCFRGKKEEARRKREEGRGKREEGRRKREEGRGKREEGRSKKQEGRGKIIPSSNLKLKIQNSNLKTIPHTTLPTSCLATSAIFDMIN
ncbi:hypothetical protein [Microcoleus vaginatus]|uniref:hypothetical protein n=1 Tax=Microcoleus vaginatus TaxID=119532 RepID=UPI001F6023D1